MTAAIFNLRDYQSKKKGIAPTETLEQQAVSIINVALADHLDTAPCEYVAPEADPS